MPLSTFAARATTCDVSPGDERADDAGVLHIRGRIFTDIVESADPRVAGTNQPVLDIDLDPRTGEGELRGRFVLRLESVDGGWEGELHGRLRQGLVTASGLARGIGALDGAVLRVDFRQVPERSGAPPCATPTAFFEMDGLVLERG